MKEPLIKRDLRRLGKFARKAWWIGLALGLVCHFVPAEYHAACHAIVNACTP